MVSFVARRKIAQRLLQRLEEITLTGLAPHYLILGQRGMGKTSMLRRLALGIMQSQSLGRILLPLTFREEQYNVHNLHVFWCNCLDALGDWYEKTNQMEKASHLDDQIHQLSRDHNDKTGESAHQLFESITKSENLRPVLFLDNIDIILNGLKSQQWGLRRILQKPGGVVVVGASAFYMEALADREAAFYDFFQVTVLQKLSNTDLLGCLRRLAKLRGPDGSNVLKVINEDSGRIHTLYNLTGGNPRTLILLYLLLEMDTTGDVFSDLEQLLDQVTVLYKARVEDLAPQARVVLDALALEWNPITAANLATASGIGTSAVSTHLDRMRKDGLVEKVSLSSTRKAAYQISERFFNIWYLMRHAPRRQRTRLRWLTAFLRNFYTPDQLKDRARTLLLVRNGSSIERQEYCLALGEAIEDPGWRKLLGYEATETIEKDTRDSNGKLSRDVEVSDIPLPVTAEDWIVQGRLLSTVLNRYEQSEKAIRKAIELDPYAAPAWEGLGVVLHYHLGQYEAAEDAYRKAIELDPERAQPWGMLGDLLQDHLGRPDEAEDAYQRAVKLDPEWSLPWGRLGDVLHYRLERHEDAEQAYRMAIELDPKRAAVPWGVLGILLHRKLGRLDEAAEAYQKAIELDPDRAAVPWRSLGSLYHYRLDCPEKAEEAYRKSIQLDATQGSSFGMLGDLLAYRLDRPEEAVEAYEKAIENDPNRAYAWQRLGEVLHYGLKKIEEAETAYRKAIKLDPKRGRPWGMLGDLLQDNLGRLDEAECAYHKATELDPEWSLPWGRLGDLLHYRLERPEDAEHAYRRAIELDPQRAATPWRVLGILLQQKLDRPEEAEAAYRKSIELEPNQTEAWVGLGILLEEEFEKYEDAEKAYRQAIKIDPKKPAAWARLGVLLQLYLECHDEGMDACRTAAELDDTVAGWNSLADFLLALPGHGGDAMDAYRRAINVMPESGREWALRGYLLFYLFDRRKDAAHDFQKALDLDPTNLASRTNLLALHLLESKGNARVNEEFRAVVNELPESGAALLKGICEISRDNFKKASCSFLRSLSTEDPDVFGRYRGFFVLFLRLTASRNLGEDLLQIFDKEGLSERYWPVYAALDAFINGEAQLKNVNPEVRGVATEIYIWLRNTTSLSTQP